MRTAQQLTNVEWAREYGTLFNYRAQLDNNEPPRRQTHGRCWFYNRPDRPAGEGVILEQAEDFRDAHEAVFLLDSGLSVAPYYPAGWHAEQSFVILHPFPLSIGTRPDNGRPIDMSGWQFGPRRCYHLKTQVA